MAGLTKHIYLSFLLCLFLDAMRTVEYSPHRFATFCLDVSLLKTSDDTFSNAPGELNRKETTDETEVVVIASGILPTEDALQDYFENERRSGGGEVLSVNYNDDGEAIVTFAKVKGKLGFSGHLL